MPTFSFRKKKTRGSPVRDSAEKSSRLLAMGSNDASSDLLAVGTETRGARVSGSSRNSTSSVASRDGIISGTTPVLAENLRSSIDTDRLCLTDGISSAPATPSKSRTADEDPNPRLQHIRRKPSIRSNSKRLVKAFRGNLRRAQSSALLAPTSNGQSDSDLETKKALDPHKPQKNSSDLHHGPGSMVSLFQKFVSDSGEKKNALPKSASTTSIDLESPNMRNYSVPTISFEDLTLHQDSSISNQVGDPSSISISHSPSAVSRSRSVNGTSSPGSAPMRHRHQASFASVHSHGEKSSKSLFSFSSNSSSDLNSFSSRFRRKAIPRLFSADNITKSEQLRTENSRLDSSKPEFSAPDADYLISGSAGITNASTDSASPLSEEAYLQPNRPFPMIRSISSKSQENRREDTKVDQSENGTRPRSRTLNSLVQEDDDRTSPAHSGSTSGAATPLGNLNLSSLFGVKNESVKRHSPSSSQTNTLIHAPEIEAVVPLEGETVEEYLHRLKQTKLSSTIAVILSKSDSEFFHEALQKYIDENFDFKDDPMDMSLRKFLMYVQLPKETQQIDRVLDCLATSYHKSNPNIYSSAEEAYIVVFSLMILHTDFFNRNNRHKMQKSEYVRNTYAKGVHKDVLECFYDNITYTPFIHTDEEVGQPGNVNARYWTRRSTSFGRNGKDLIDPYALLLENKLEELRQSLSGVLTQKDPYDFLHITSKEEFMSLREQFVHGPYLQLVSQRSRPEAFLSPNGLEDPERGVPGIVDIKVVKIGILYRREAKRMIYSKSIWKEWGAILTASQLYLFKDVSWIKSCLMNHHNAPDEYVGDEATARGRIIRAHIDGFHPSAVLSTNDMAALLHDTGEVGQPHAFILAGHGGAQDWFATATEIEMDDWMKKINFAASFNTYHIGIYGIGNTDRSAELKHKLQTQIDSSPLLSGAESDSDDRESIDELSASEYLSPLYDRFGEADKLHDHSQRYDAVIQKLEEIDERLYQLDDQVNHQIRTANHLKLLAPIQQRTKEAVHFAAAHLRANMSWNWLDRKRLVCYKELFVMEKEVEKDLCELLREDTPDGQLVPPGSVLSDDHSISTQTPTLSRTASNHSHSETLTPQASRPATFRSTITYNSDENIPADFNPASPMSSNSLYFEASSDINLPAHVPLSRSTTPQSFVSPGPSSTSSPVQRQTSIVSGQSHISVKTNTSSPPKSSAPQITVKKNFHRLSLRETKQPPSSPGRDQNGEGAKEVQRSASLMRKENGDFTIHGKKFSVVEVNPEFAATPNHQRRTSQNLNYIDVSSAVSTTGPTTPDKVGLLPALEEGTRFHDEEKSALSEKPSSGSLRAFDENNGIDQSV